MANRDLRHGEKRMAVFSSEKGRDRANAQRAIEGLSQNDQIIALLSQQVALLMDQNAMLRWMCDYMHMRQDVVPAADAAVAGP